MKPMKPCKAWVIVNQGGHLAKTSIGTPIMRATQNNPCDWVEDDERFVRVRILDDAAVERALRALRIAARNDSTYGLTYRDAIRDLGGKP